MSLFGTSGAIQNAGTMTLASTTVSGNTTNFADLDNAGTMTLNNATVAGNTARSAAASSTSAR